MKFTAIIFLSACLTASANGYSQKVTLSEKNATLEKVFAVIKKQTGYGFLYTDEMLKPTGRITIELKNVELKEALEACFKNQPVTYAIIEKTVVIKPRDVNPPKEDLPPPPVDVKGRVLNEKGEPVQGATVTVKGTRIAVATDVNGFFNMRGVNENATLVITGVNIETVEIKLNGKNDLDISVKTKVSELSDITVSVNTGYQVISREKSVGSAVTVGSAELEKRYNPNIIENLEGRIPGLVQYRGTTTIRGVSTLRASTQVLVVVDGLPIEGSVANINPYDVETVTVLKDAAATAVYGVRATNGVIVITTKKAKQGRTTVEVSSDITRYQKPNYSDYNYMTPSQQVDFEKDYFNFYFNGGVITTPTTQVETAITNGTAISPVMYASYALKKGLITQAQFDTQIAGFKQNDFAQQYKDLALENRLLQQYNMAVRTSGGKLQSSLVLNYKTDNNGIINQYNKQLNITYKGTYDVAKWLDINFGVNTVIGKIQTHASAFATSPFNVSPYMNLVENGQRINYATSNYNVYNPMPDTNRALYSLKFNHLDELERDFTTTNQRNSRYWANLNFKIMRGLTFNPQFQYEDNQTDASTYNEAESYTMRWLKNIYVQRAGTAPNYTYTSLLPTTGGRLATSFTRNTFYSVRPQINFSRQFNKHDISVIGGLEFRQTRTRGNRNLLLGYNDQLQSQATTSVNYQALSLITSTFLRPGLNPASGGGIYATNISGAIGLVQDIIHRFGSGYATASYTYNRKYNVFSSFRKDYADVFGLDPKYRGKPLWSAGLGWNISNEPFMAAVKFVDYLKLRATYGITGSMDQSITSYLTASTTSINPVTRLPWGIVSGPANPELRWEKTASTNLGLDFVLFNNRLNGSLDWYRKQGDDIFAPRRLDPSQGFTSQVINNGGLLNNGFEISLDYDWIKGTKRNDFNWSSLLVITTNNNKITYVDEVTTSPQSLAEGQGFKVGYPVRALYSYQFAGLDSLGRTQFKKADGTLTTDLLENSDISAVVFSGGQDPRLNLALTNEIYFKGFSLNILMVYYGGHYMRALQPYAVPGTGYGPLPNWLLNSWTPSKKETDVPGFGQYYQSNFASSFQFMSQADKFVYKADFLKIRNIVLGYTLPDKWAKKMGATSARLRFQLNTPRAIWQKSDINVDPETAGAAVLGSNITSPIVSSYVVGFNINF